MNQNFKIISAFGLFFPLNLFLVSCASVTPVPGILYADVNGPVAATAHPRGNARGEACATSFFGLVGMGDASISAAAKNGGIAAVSLVESHTTNIIGYSKYCTIVWGARTVRGPIPTGGGAPPPPLPPSSGAPGNAPAEP